MTEEGMLSIVRRGIAYQVHYAPSNPHGLDRQPYPCPDEDSLVTLLHHCGLDSWSIRQAGTELQRGRMAVMSLVCLQEQVQAYFPLSGPQPGALAAAA